MLDCLIAVSAEFDHYPTGRGLVILGLPLAVKLRGRCQWLEWGTVSGRLPVPHSRHSTVELAIGTCRHPPMPMVRTGAPFLTAQWRCFRSLPQRWRRQHGTNDRRYGRGCRAWRHLCSSRRPEPRRSATDCGGTTPGICRRRPQRNCWCASGLAVDSCSCLAVVASAPPVLAASGRGRVGGARRRS
jgi:hypothetical protein